MLQNLHYPSLGTDENTLERSSIDLRLKYRLMIANLVIDDSPIKKHYGSI